VVKHFYLIPHFVRLPATQIEFYYYCLTLSLVRMKKVKKKTLRCLEIYSDFDTYARHTGSSSYIQVRSGIYRTLVPMFVSQGRRNRRQGSSRGATACYMSASAVNRLSARCCL